MAYQHQNSRASLTSKAFRIMLRCVRHIQPPPDIDMIIHVDGRSIAGMILDDGEEEGGVETMFIEDEGDEGEGKMREAEMIFASLVSKAWAQVV